MGKMASKNSPKLRKVLDRMESEDGYVYSENNVYKVAPSGVGQLVKSVADDISQMGTDGISLLDMMKLSKLTASDVNAIYVSSHGDKNFTR